MFKALLMALAIALTTSLFAQSKAATEAWVANYVSNQVAAIAATKTQSYKDGVNSISMTENGTNITVKIEDSTVYALILKNCAPVLEASGITNNITFAYTDNGIYKNKSNTIQATATNLILNATYHSQENQNQSYFYDGEKPIAEIYWTFIQPSVAKKLTD